MDNNDWSLEFGVSYGRGTPGDGRICGDYKLATAMA